MSMRASNSMQIICIMKTWKNQTKGLDASRMMIMKNEFKIEMQVAQLDSSAFNRIYILYRFIPYDSYGNLNVSN